MCHDIYVCICSGYNPTRKLVQRYWIDSTRRITYSQFCNLSETEPVPKENDLLSAFEKLDDHAHGYLNHEGFLTNMTARGEKLPHEAMKIFLKDKEFNSDNKFDYRTFCKTVQETSDKLGELAVEKYKHDEEQFSVNSKTYKVKRKASLPSPKMGENGQDSKKSLASPDISTWTVAHSKGSFYFEGENAISHQYLLTIDTNSKVNISVKVTVQT